jgi:hypothetical protein
MSLTSVGDIIAEQGRVYRLRLNGRLKTDDMLKMITALREIRSSIESLPPEPVVMPAMNISVVSVPTGFSIDAESGEARPTGYIEHQSKEAPLALEAPANEPTMLVHQPSELPTPEQSESDVHLETRLKTELRTMNRLLEEFINEHR